MRLISIVLPLLAICTTLGNSRGQDGQQPTSVEKTLEQRIDEIHRAKDAGEARKLYEALWVSLSPTEIGALKYHSDRETALRACWRDTVVPHLKQRSRPNVEAASKARHQFLGFLEGRVRAEPPAWWIHDVLEQFGDKYENVYHMTDAGIQAPLDTSIKLMGPNLRVTIADQTREIPRELLDKDMDWLSLALVGDKLILANHYHWPLSYNLSCFDTKNRKLEWKKQVFAGGDAFVFSGLGRHWVSIAVKPDKVLVWGSAGFMLYLEEFSVRDGSVGMRFNTRY
jgi:hypothetical protein